MRTKLLSFLVLVFLFTLTESRRGGGGSRSSSSSSGSRSSWFGGSRSSSSSSSSNSRSGSWAGSGSSSSRGSSGSNYPKQQYGSGGSRPSGGSRTPIGGGGFVNPKVTSYGSSYGAKSTYSYKSPGYGTKFGTSFPGGVGKYGGKGFSKKALGLGVGAGFIGGAALGVAGTAATMGVYHRYMQYRFLTGGWGHNPYYYNNYYYGNNCWGGCPWNAHCEWGFCECNRGYEKRYGHCQREDSPAQPRPNGFDPFKTCDKNTTCLEIDLNLICNTNLTIQNVGKCECRENMRWNTEAGECQLYLDVDCSTVTYETKPSTVVLEAVNKTLDSLEGKNTTEINLSDPSKPENQTISASPNATLANSLLSSIDKDKASKEDIKEAFCRDIDSFSWELGKPERQRQISSGGSRSVGSIVGIVIGIIAITALCCCCCVCFCCKGAFDKIKKSFKSDKSYDDNGGGGMTFSNVQQSAGDPSYPPSYPVQPQGYDNAPPAIPPSQPGYSNYPPEYDTNTSGPVYPPQYPPQYPPTNQAPYPPVSQPMYPPVNQPPFNPGPNY